MYGLFKTNSLICRCGLWLGICLISFSSWNVPSVRAEDQDSIAIRLHTDVNFQLLLPKIRPNGLASQQWAEIFRQFDVLLQIRQPVSTDKPGIDQQILGTTRRVTVTAQLDSNGDIVLAEKRFRRSDVVKLGEWIRELKTYGAQGAPEDAPLWGLQKAEFLKLQTELRKPVSAETLGRPMTEALSSLDLPLYYPLAFSSDAARILQQESLTTRNELQQVAKGTALAILLREMNLAFEPKRLPNESIVLNVDLASEIVKSWPIGWDPTPLGLTRIQLAKDFYVPTNVEVPQKSMNAYLDEMSAAVNLPVFVDGLAIDSLSLNFDEVLVSYPRAHTSWSISLRTLLSKMKLTQELRIDENDRPFLWITRFQPTRRSTP